MVTAIPLPAHAQTSPVTTTPTVPTSPTAFGCNPGTCSSGASASDGMIGALVFDGSSCFLQMDNGAAIGLFADPNMILTFDNNSSGSVILGVGNANWTIAGISSPDQLFGTLGSGSVSRTFTGTNLAGEQFEFCLTIDRDGDAADPIGTENIVYSVDIGPL